MARSEIPVTEIVRAGTEAGAVAQITADATNDHFITANDGRVFLEVASTDGGAQTVDIVANPTPGGTFDGLTIDPLTLSIPAGETWFFGPFRPYTFQQDSSGMMHINPSVSTTLKFRAYQLPAAAQA